MAGGMRQTCGVTAGTARGQWQARSRRCGKRATVFYFKSASPPVPITFELKATPPKISGDGCFHPAVMGGIVVVEVSHRGLHGAQNQDEHQTYLSTNKRKAILTSTMQSGVLAC